ncbi:MAG: tRNA (adenosine(37)-N6)-dimethylallyltransferase MiaA [Planctomycetota bacterium]|nr:tRNA (adenosine(37)-N6)-dimethylallyltransferase MiaA [Planctomycetota bacterium]
MTSTAATNPALRPIVLLGPTAGGKSELAVELALGPIGPGEILSADSMQVYKRMEAGTAKPSAELRARAVHHLLDVVEPTERFTVADWIARADELIASLQANGRRPIVVGGTNLYIKALLEGMFEGPAIDLAFRASLADATGAELHRRLAEADPVSAQRIHPNDHKKLVRALEVFAVTGRPISAMQTQWGRAESSNSEPRDPESIRPTGVYRHNPILIGLAWPHDALNRRINARVKRMFLPEPPGTESLPDEVARLETAGLLGPQAREALGYKQVLDQLAGRMSLDDAMEKTKILTRRFAKSQRTWLKRYLNVRWLEAADATVKSLAAQAAEHVRRVESQTH